MYVGASTHTDRLDVTDDGLKYDAFRIVSGDMPSKEDPWFFNVYRQRMRGGTRQLSGFSPTGSVFLKPDKFGKLIAH